MKSTALLITACLFSVNIEAADITPETITLPPAVRTQFFANMRDHLSAVSEIQLALAEDRFDDAASIAQHRLGLGASSSAACRMPGMKMASETPAPRTDNSTLSKFMPPEMHGIGFKMHTAADRFAQDVKKAAATRDYHAAVSSLANITRQCVACHAHFRIAGR